MNLVVMTSFVEVLKIFVGNFCYCVYPKKLKSCDKEKFKISLNWTLQYEFLI